jgi:hypothetical protein
MSLKGDNLLWQRKYELASHDLETLRLASVDKDKEIQKLKKKISDMEESIVVMILEES